MKTNFIFLTCLFLLLAVLSENTFAQEQTISKFENQPGAVKNTTTLRKSAFELKTIQIGVTEGLTFSTYDYVVGGDVMLNFEISEKLLFTTDVAFSNFAIKGRRDATFIPVKLGLKYFMKDKLYLMPEIGTAVRLSKVKKPDYVFALGIGYALEDLDFSLRYEDYTEFDGSQLSLRIAYSF